MMNTTVKAAPKKIASVAAVLPIVSSSTKTVFLKIVKANGERSKEATVKALEAKKFENFDTALRQFVKQNSDAHVWNSRCAAVQPKRVAKSALNQLAFWTKQGFTVVNADTVTA